MTQIEPMKRPEWFSNEAAEEAVQEKLGMWIAHHNETPFRVFPGAVMPVQFVRAELPYMEQVPFEIGIVWVTEDQCRVVETHSEAFYTAKLRGIETIAVFREDQLGDFFNVPFQIQSTISSDRNNDDEASPEGEGPSNEGSGSLSTGKRDVPISEQEDEGILQEPVAISPSRKNR